MCQKENERDFDTMNTVFTNMCPSFNVRLSLEEQETYGVDVSQDYECPGAAACTYAHEQGDIRRELYMSNG